MKFEVPTPLCSRAREAESSAWEWLERCEVYAVLVVESRDSLCYRWVGLKIASCGTSGRDLLEQMKCSRGVGVASAQSCAPVNFEPYLDDNLTHTGAMIKADDIRHGHPTRVAD